MQVAETRGEKNASRERIMTISDGLSGRDGLFVGPRTDFCTTVPIKFHRDFSAISAQTSVATI